MPFNLGAPELIIILVIALLVIGPGKLPDVGQALGKSIREFRKASSDIQESVRVDTEALPPQAASAQAVPAAQAQPAVAPVQPVTAPVQAAAPVAQPAAAPVPEVPATPTPQPAEPVGAPAEQTADTH
jgi:TatA/E family protein of Tat protein translocase